MLAYPLYGKLPLLSVRTSCSSMETCKKQDSSGPALCPVRPNMLARSFTKDCPGRPMNAHGLAMSRQVLICVMPLTRFRYLGPVDVPNS
jgi:hypothetical protein